MATNIDFSKMGTTGIPGWYQLPDGRYLAPVTGQDVPPNQQISMNGDNQAWWKNPADWQVTGFDNYFDENGGGVGSPVYGNRKPYETVQLPNGNWAAVLPSNIEFGTTNTAGPHGGIQGAFDTLAPMVAQAFLGAGLGAAAGIGPLAEGGAAGGAIDPAGWDSSIGMGDLTATQSSALSNLGSTAGPSISSLSELLNNNAGATNVFPQGTPTPDFGLPNATSTNWWDQPAVPGGNPLEMSGPSSLSELSKSLLQQGGIDPSLLRPTPPNGLTTNLGNSDFGQFTPTASNIPPGTSSALKRIYDSISNGSMPAGADVLTTLGQLAPGLLGAYGASQAASQAGNLADKYMALGAPSRGRYEQSFQPGFMPPEIQTAIDAANESGLRKLSATGGNPFGNPGGLMELNKYVTGNVALPALQNYRSQNAATGGYSAFNASAPTMASDQIAGILGITKGLGNSVSSVLNPQEPNSNDMVTLNNLLKKYAFNNGANNGSNTGLS